VEEEKEVADAVVESRREKSAQETEKTEVRGWRFDVFHGPEPSTLRLSCAGAMAMGFLGMIYPAAGY